jgi:hypothetical protein
MRKIMDDSLLNRQQVQRDAMRSATGEHPLGSGTEGMLARISAEVTDAARRRLAQQAHVVRVKRDRGDSGLFYATSPDLIGLAINRPTLLELDAAIPQAITDLFLARDIAVVVTAAAQQDAYMRWIATPIKHSKPSAS